MSQPQQPDINIRCVECEGFLGYYTHKERWVTIHSILPDVGSNLTFRTDSLGKLMSTLFAASEHGAKDELSGFCRRCLLKFIKEKDEMRQSEKMAKTIISLLHWLIYAVACFGIVYTIGSLLFGLW